MDNANDIFCALCPFYKRVVQLDSIIKFLELFRVNVDSLHLITRIECNEVEMKGWGGKECTCIRAYTKCWIYQWNIFATKYERR